MLTASEGELRDVQEQFGRAVEDAHDLLDELSEAQLKWRPGEGRWSILECVEHLRATGTALYVPRMEEAVKRARARGMKGRGPFRHGWIGNRFARSLEPPPRLRIKTTRPLRPSPDLDPDRTVHGYFALQDRWIELAAQADGLDLAAVKIRSPIAPVLRFTLGQCFTINAAHQRRHLWQARQVREMRGFPTA